MMSQSLRQAGMGTPLGIGPLPGVYLNAINFLEGEC